MSQNPAEIKKSAILSPDGVYRYRLERTWDEDLGLCNFIMLNPSTADADADDPTIRRSVNFASSWGYGTLVVTNLFALRATDPRQLRGHRDPIGIDNDFYIAREAGSSDLVVIAWGNNGLYRGRCHEVLRLLANNHVTPHCLALTKYLQPAHPLYLAAHLKPKRLWLQ